MYKCTQIIIGQQKGDNCVKNVTLIRIMYNGILPGLRHDKPLNPQKYYIWRIVKQFDFDCDDDHGNDEDVGDYDDDNDDDDYDGDCNDNHGDDDDDYLDNDHVDDDVSSS